MKKKIPLSPKLVCVLSYLNIYDKFLKRNLSLQIMYWTCFHCFLTLEMCLQDKKCWLFIRVIPKKKEYSPTKDRVISLKRQNLIKLETFL